MVNVPVFLAIEIYACNNNLCIGFGYVSHYVLGISHVCLLYIHQDPMA